jgi:RimJ/RimL family protein N-acetyltransferase
MPFETSRLRVRHFTLEDTPGIYALSQEPGMRRFLPDQVYADEAEARGVLEFLIAQYSDPAALEAGVYVQAVELSESGELIGHLGLSPTEDQREIGYALAEAHQGQGYASELVRGATRWALEDLAEGALWGIVASDNVASIRVLEKAGFRLVEERELHGSRGLVRTYRAEIAAPSG